MKFSRGASQLGKNFALVRWCSLSSPAISSSSSNSDPRFTGERFYPSMDSGGEKACGENGQRTNNPTNMAAGRQESRGEDEKETSLLASMVGGCESSTTTTTRACWYDTRIKQCRNIDGACQSSLLSFHGSCLFQLHLMEPTWCVMLYSSSFF
jgi:hypothetical protein